MPKQSIQKSRQKPRTARMDEKRVDDFLAALAEGASVSGATHASGFPRATAYERRKDDPDFAARWDAAIETGTDVLEDEAKRRGTEGVDKPVFHKGQVCGYVREYSDTLLIFMLKGRRPDKFRDNVKLEVSGTMELAERLKRAKERTKS